MYGANTETRIQTDIPETLKFGHLSCQIFKKMPHSITIIMNVGVRLPVQARLSLPSCYSFIS